jgi:hypothetical protein
LAPKVASSCWRTVSTKYGAGEYPCAGSSAVVIGASFAFAATSAEMNPSSAMRCNA